MKKSNIIAIIIVIAIIIIGVAIGVKNHNEINNDTAEPVNNVTVQEDKIPVPEDAAQFFEDYTNLQNEASRKVETGELSEEKYFDLLSKGIEIAQMKEEYEANGEDDELREQIEDIKPYLYDLAKEMNSELVDKFE